MKTTDNTILITGGSAGIGLAMGHALVEAGNRVLICGRDERKLQAVAALLPGVLTRTCDVANAQQREALCEWAVATAPSLNVLINNAGAQKPIDLTRGVDGFVDGPDEIAINLEAPIHLCALLIPHLLRQAEAAIVNVTSGLAFAPLARVPVYCATKAALHSFTLSLRHQLADSPIKVFELAPPRVDTELGLQPGQAPLPQYRGIPVAEVVDAMIEGLARDQWEILVGTASHSRSDPERAFSMMNG